MKQISNLNKKQQGYTIVEVLIGVIVAVIVLVTIYAGWNSFYSSNSASTISSEVTQIIQNTQALYAKASDGYTSLSMTDAISANVFPDTLRINTTAKTVTNSYNGDVALAKATNGFTLSYVGIPEDVCVKVITGIGSSNLTTLDTSISATLWAAGSTWPTAALIIKACTPATNGAGVTITFGAY